MGIIVTHYWILFSSKIDHRFQKRTQTTNDCINTNERYPNYRNNNTDLGIELPDYRQQYINGNSKSNGNNQLIDLNDRQQLYHKNSITSTAYSDFEHSSMNMMTTPLFSPSINSLPTDDVQFSRDYSLRGTSLTNSDSILVRAFTKQERQKAIYS